MTRLGDLVDPRRIGARPCWRKVRYLSHGAAKAHLRALLRRPDVYGAETLKAYPCRYCAGFHVGHLHGLSITEENL